MMKWQTILLVAAITVLGLPLMCFADLPETVDASKARVEPCLVSVRHACWPSERYLSAKCATNVDVSGEIGILEQILSATLRQRYQPASSLFNLGHVIAATNLYDSGDDYLLLRYLPAKDLTVEVQDGKTLCMLIQSASWSSNGISDIGPFVQGVAFDLFSYPPQVKARDLKVFVSIMDIGKSKWGDVRWGQDDQSRFSVIWWWSDGKRILFSLQKATEKEFEARQKERRSSPTTHPDLQHRRFGKPWWGSGYWGEPGRLEPVRPTLTKQPASSSNVGGK